MVTQPNFDIHQRDMLANTYPTEMCAITPRVQAMMMTKTVDTRILHYTNVNKASPPPP
jgi:hypothetical protein